MPTQNTQGPISSYDAWHLVGEFGVNIEEAWSRYDGSGVVIGFVDEGFDISDHDLSANFRADLSYDLASSGQVVAGSSNAHGTAVSHTAIAADDGAGGLGIAFGADWAALSIVFGGSGSGGRSGFLSASQNQDIDVINNSWTNISRGHSPRGAFEQASENGRDGLGQIVVFSAGNGRNGDDVGFSNESAGTSSHWGAITVAATTQSGEISSISSLGSNVLVAAPGARVEIEEGRYVSGTSYAAPIVSGVAALMLEANEDLGLRDVQEILAISSRQISETDGSWITNNATHWNGGGMTFSNNFGFGLVDASAAVNLAEYWEDQSTSVNMVSVVDYLGEVVDETAFSFQNFMDIDMEIEKVNVRYTGYADDWSSSILELVSPEGTVSEIFTEQDAWYDTPSAAFDESIQPSLFSNAFRGESSLGEWTLRLRDAETNEYQEFNTWWFGLDFYGSAASTDDVHFLTRDFESLVIEDPERAILRDQNGGVDTLNVTASSSDQYVDLSGGWSSFNEARFRIADGSAMERVLSGHGDDTVLDNAQDNEIKSGGGDDEITISLGDDIVDGGEGNDLLILEGVASTEIEVSRLDGGYRISSAMGTDDIYGVEEFVFTDGSQDDRFLFVASQNDPLHVSGSDDNDHLVGQNGADTLRGFAGDDSLYGDDGSDILVGHEGNDLLIGGATSQDLRDLLYGGDGDDSLDGGYGNDELRGDAGNDTISGGFGADTVIGGTGNDVLTGSAFSDLVYGGAGDDFVNGGWGHDRVNGGDGADRFFHVGIFDHGSDWIQDYNSVEGDILQFGINSATRENFQVNTTHTLP
ncbi:S8 family serine peptidase [Shimia thalassica]|uniref:S8 family serine peptidase n=1 Tax=Shimia thalassica TaxID=1715693 RepID=UPI002732CD61|nr:S8 family serine peptidase [Shimia thalassica]MDP2520893.1 S8 family serine peptidase [Shimia thalassica]